MSNFAKTLLSIAAVFIVGVSCQKEEDTDYSSTSVLVGEYVGTVKIMGYVDEPERAYATVARRSSDVISFQLYCEPLDLDLSPVNLIVEKKNDIVYLTSESSYAIEGSVAGGVLTVNFSVGDYVFIFNGKKD